MACCNYPSSLFVDLTYLSANTSGGHTVDGCAETYIDPPYADPGCGTAPGGRWNGGLVDYTEEGCYWQLRPLAPSGMFDQYGALNGERTFIERDSMDGCFWRLSIACGSCGFRDLLWVGQRPYDSPLGTYRFIAGCNDTVELVEVLEKPLIEFP